MKGERKVSVRDHKGGQGNEGKLRESDGLVNYMEKETPTSVERQMYQLHKKGYEEIAKAIKDVKITAETEVDVRIVLEVNGAVIEDVKITDDEEENA